MELIKASESLLVVIDVQEKLVKMLADNNVKNNAAALARAASILNIPAIVTEQYPKGLGQTVDEVKTPLCEAQFVEKTNFSAYREDNFREALKPYPRKRIVIFGIETHICVLQTVFELRETGFDVFVVENACGSRRETDKNSAIERMRLNGVQIVTAEQVIFEWLGSSKHPKFKEVQAVVKAL